MTIKFYTDRNFSLTEIWVKIIFLNKNAKEQQIQQRLIKKNYMLRNCGRTRATDVVGSLEAWWWCFTVIQYVSKEIIKFNCKWYSLMSAESEPNDIYDG
jgi:hypothetical protein